MSFLTYIPIIGPIIEKALEFAIKKWGFNKTDQEIQIMTQEILAQANILEAVKELYKSIVAYEGSADELSKFGWAGRIIMLARSTWRPILQWGMTIKVMEAMFIQGKPLDQMYVEIGFVGGLAAMREVGKWKNGNEK